MRFEEAYYGLTEDRRFFVALENWLIMSKGGNYLICSSDSTEDGKPQLSSANGSGVQGRGAFRQGPPMMLKSPHHVMNGLASGMKDQTSVQRRQVWRCG